MGHKEERVNRKIRSSLLQQNTLYTPNKTQDTLSVSCMGLTRPNAPDISDTLSGNVEVVLGHHKGGEMGSKRGWEHSQVGGKVQDHAHHLYCLLK